MRALLPLLALSLSVSAMRVLPVSKRPAATARPVLLPKGPRRSLLETAAPGPKMVPVWNSSIYASLSSRPLRVTVSDEDRNSGRSYEINLLDSITVRTTERDGEVIGMFHTPNHGEPATFADRAAAPVPYFQLASPSECQGEELYDTKLFVMCATLSSGYGRQVSPCQYEVYLYTLDACYDDRALFSSPSFAWKSLHDQYSDRGLKFERSTSDGTMEYAVSLGFFESATLSMTKSDKASKDAPLEVNLGQFFAYTPGKDTKSATFYIRPTPNQAMAMQQCTPGKTDMGYPATALTVSCPEAGSDGFMMVKFYGVHRDNCVYEITLQHPAFCRAEDGARPDAALFSGPTHSVDSDVVVASAGCSDRDLAAAAASASGLPNGVYRYPSQLAHLEDKVMNYVPDQSIARSEERVMFAFNTGTVTLYSYDSEDMIYLGAFQELTKKYLGTTGEVVDAWPLGGSTTRYITQQRNSALSAYAEAYYYETTLQGGQLDTACPTGRHSAKIKLVCTYGSAKSNSNPKVAVPDPDDDCSLNLALHGEEFCDGGVYTRESPKKVINNFHDRAMANRNGGPVRAMRYSSRIYAKARKA